MGAVASGLCLAVQGLCCACSCFKCLCSSALGDHGVKPWQAKLYYVLFLAAGTLISFLVGKFGEDKVQKDFKFKDFEIFSLTVSCEEITGQQVCSGDSAVLRASFASVLFFGVCFLGTINVPTFSGDKSWRPLLGEGFHNGWWIFKILIYFALLIGSFFMKFFDDDAYTGVARFVSMIFLALQVLVLIDFAYVWNESWLERSGVDDDFSDGSKMWLYALLAITGILFLTTFGGLITILIFYKGCTDTIAFAAVNLILVIIFIIITVFRESIVGEQASIAPAAIVSAYTVFLTWSASQSNPNVSDECDPFDLQLGKNKAEIFIGLAIGTLTLVWTAFSVSQNSKSLLEGTGDTAERPGVSGAYEIQETDGTTKYAADAAPSQNVGEAADETGSDERLWVFHAIMITASFYMSMSLTNWGVKEQDVEVNGSQVGLISMYVKMAANWAASLLFIWTLIAPAVLPDRDF